MLHSLDSYMTSSRSFVSAILLAGGRGTRMQTCEPKQFLPMQGKLLSFYSFETLSACPLIKEIIIVCQPAYFSLFEAPHLSLKWAPPGKLRQDSVFNALNCVSKDAELLCIHDAARPFLSHEDLLIVIEAGFTHKAAALASPAKNTIKQSDENAFVARTLERCTLWEIYTPQVTTPSLLEQGFAIAKERSMTATDDMSLVELTGHPVKLVKGSSAKMKITCPQDLAIANALLKMP